MDDFALHVGQAAFEAVVVKGQSLMLQPEQVQDRRVKIMHCHNILHGLVAEFIRRAVGVAAFYPGPGKPRGEAVGIVVAPARPGLEGWHPAKLGAPDHERLLEQPALFHVGQQGGHRLVEHRAVLGVLLGKHLVAVPVAHSLAAGLVGAVEKLHEPHALLDEPTRGIDVGSKAQIYRLMNELAGQGRALVFVSSYLPELLGVCDRIGVMCRGELTEVRPVVDWSEPEIIRAALGQAETGEVAA